MIVVEITGGLGNQLFQYAFYLYQKKMNPGSDVRISNLSCCEHNGYELESAFKAISLPLIGSFRLFTWRVAKKMLNALPVYSQAKKDFRYSVPGLGEYYLGCWQQPSFVERVGQELRHDLSFIPFTDSKNIRFSEHLLSLDYTVALHVRRGDYLKHPLLFRQLCDSGYYQDAIVYMKERLSHPVFVVFSDDIDWCQKHLPVSDEVYYVDWNRGANSFRDMQLMSLCKHAIIANSTFSWWGAWLNANPQKIVITAKDWFIGRSVEGMIDIPPSWIRI